MGDKKVKHILLTLVCILQNHDCLCYFCHTVFKTVVCLNSDHFQAYPESLEASVMCSSGQFFSLHFWRSISPHHYFDTGFKIHFAFTSSCANLTLFVLDKILQYTPFLNQGGESPVCDIAGGGAGVGKYFLQKDLLFSFDKFLSSFTPISQQKVLIDVQA